MPRRGRGKCPFDGGMQPGEDRPHGGGVCGAQRRTNPPTDDHPGGAGHGRCLQGARQRRILSSRNTARGSVGAFLALLSVLTLSGGGGGRLPVAEAQYTGYPGFWFLGTEYTTPFAGPEVLSKIQDKISPCRCVAHPACMPRLEGPSSLHSTAGTLHSHIRHAIPPDKNCALPGCQSSPAACEWPHVTRLAMQVRGHPVYQVEECRERTGRPRPRHGGPKPETPNPKNLLGVTRARLSLAR